MCIPRPVGGPPSPSLSVGVVLRTAALLPISVLKLQLENCGLDGPEYLEDAVCIPLRALRRRGFLRSLRLDLSSNRFGSEGIQRLVNAIVDASSVAGEDRLERLKLVFWDMRLTNLTESFLECDYQKKKILELIPFLK